MDPGNDILVSAVSFWELSIKYGLGKIELTGTTPDRLPGIAATMGFETIPLDVEESASFYRLPREMHRDPFDRMLIWQAISRRLPLITKAPEFAAYGPQGLVVFW